MYWKGSVFPQVPHHDTAESMYEEYRMCKEAANEMIVDGLKNDMSIPQQIEVYTKQLNKIELFMRSLEQKYNSPIDLSCNKYIKAFHNLGLYEFNMPHTDTTKDTLEKLWVLWTANIFALLKMGVIQNDDFHGTHFVHITE